MSNTKLTKQQKKDYAKVLIVREGLTQKEAANRVGTSTVTMSKWAVEGKWKELRGSYSLTRQNQLENLYKELEELNETIQNKDKGERFADSKLADARRKLLKDIEMLEKEASASEVIEICQDLLEFTRKVDLQAAQELSKYVDGFVKSKL